MKTKNNAHYMKNHALETVILKFVGARFSADELLHITQSLKTITATACSCNKKTAQRAVFKRTFSSAA